MSRDDGRVAGLEDQVRGLTRAMVKERAANEALLVQNQDLKRLLG